MALEADNRRSAAAVTLRGVAESERDDVVTMLAAAFYNDPFIVRVAALSPRSALQCAATLLRYNVDVALAFQWPTVAAWRENLLVGAAIIAPPALPRQLPVGLHKQYRAVEAELGAEASLFVADFSQQAAALRPLRPIWQLATLAVHPDQQHQGVGAQLLAWVHQQVAASETATLWVETQSSPAVAFYQRHGYVMQQSDSYKGLRLWGLQQEMERVGRAEPCANSTNPVKRLE